MQELSHFVMRHLYANTVAIIGLMLSVASSQSYIGQRTAHSFLLTSSVRFVAAVVGAALLYIWLLSSANALFG